MRLHHHARCLTHVGAHDILIPEYMHDESGSATLSRSIVSSRPGMTILTHEGVIDPLPERNILIPRCVSLCYFFSVKGQGVFTGQQGEEACCFRYRPDNLYLYYISEPSRGYQDIPEKTSIRGFQVFMSLSVWQQLSAGFTFPAFDGDHPRHLVSSSSYWVGILPICGFLRKHISALYRLARSGSSDLMLESGTLSLLNSVCSILDHETKVVTPLARDKKTVETVKEIIADSLDYKWTVAELAAKADVSFAKLKKIFPLYTGLSVYKYLQEARLREARRMLKGGGYSVTDVALATGYTSFSHFSVLYKRRFGVCPSSIRCHTADEE